MDIDGRLWSDAPMPREGPWSQGPRSSEAPPGSGAPPPPRQRVTLSWPLALFLVAFGALVWALIRLFPETNLSGGDWADVAYLGGFALLLVAGGSRLAFGHMRRAFAQIAVWLAVAAVLSLVYAYRDELAGVPSRLAQAFGGDRPVALSEHEMVIPQAEEGAFEVVGRVNGQPVRFTIDTGASDTVLSPADARRLGIDTAALRYTLKAETANGAGYGAAFAANRLQVGQIAFDGFPMTINKSPMSRSLLGMSFLSRLDSFHMRGRELYLTWRGPAHQAQDKKAPSNGRAALGSLGLRDAALEPAAVDQPVDSRPS